MKTQLSKYDGTKIIVCVIMASRILGYTCAVPTNDGIGIINNGITILKKWYCGCTHQPWAAAVGHGGCSSGMVGVRRAWWVFVGASHRCLAFIERHLGFEELEALLISVLERAAATSAGQHSIEAAPSTRQ